MLASPGEFIQFPPISIGELRASASEKEEKNELSSADLNR